MSMNPGAEQTDLAQLVDSSNVSFFPYSNITSTWEYWYVEASDFVMDKTVQITCSGKHTLQVYIQYLYIYTNVKSNWEYII